MSKRGSLKLETVTPVSYYCPTNSPTAFCELYKPRIQRPGRKRSKPALAICLSCHRRPSVTIPARRLLCFPTVLTPYGSSQETYAVFASDVSLIKHISEILEDQTQRSRCVLTCSTVFLDNVCVYKVEASDVLSSMILLTKTFYWSKVLKVLLD